MKKYLKRIIILVVIVGVIFAAINFIKIDDKPLKSYLNLRQFLDNRDALLAQVQENRLLYSIVYILVYLGAVALSIPGAWVLTLLGGFFFGALVATLYVNIGATLGAFVIFIAARYFIGDMVQNKYGEKLKKFNREIEENGKYYMITLRLIPIFPFFMINLFAGVTKIRPITFLWTTSVGIIPGSFAYAYLGSSVAEIGLDQGVPDNLIYALLILAALSIIPVVYKKLKAKRESRQEKPEPESKSA